MAAAPLTVTFQDRTSKVLLAKLNFQSLTAVPSIGERVVLPEGQSGRVEDVEWRLKNSRVFGAVAEVYVDIAVEADAFTA